MTQVMYMTQLYMTQVNSAVMGFMGAGVPPESLDVHVQL